MRHAVWKHFRADVCRRIMLRKPGSVYEGGRSTTLLKLKSFYDAEAEVIGYEAGKGRYEGVIGALVCKMACGKKLVSDVDG